MRFALYLAAVVLLNLVGLTLFLRLDLTGDKIYSLSKASRTAVSSLTEPLTVKVFFTKDLPAPYNNIERYLHDMLEEYSVAGNRFFNYRFYDVSGDGEDVAARNRSMAEGYGISPVQIQNLKQDEVKFQKAFMGMVLLHGDIIEPVPSIPSADGLEFMVTSAIRKMSNKSSALLGLEENIEIKLYLSSSLQAVGPYMNVPALSGLPTDVSEAVGRLNDENYGRLTYAHVDPTREPGKQQEAAMSNVVSLKWNDFRDRTGRTIPAGSGFVGLVVSHAGNSEAIALLNVVRLPIFGPQYSLLDSANIEAVINEAVENVMDINEEIGWLIDHGAAGPDEALQMPQGMTLNKGLSNFSRLLSQQYSIERVQLSDGGAIPAELPALIIAGAKQEFTEYELYQIDQYLMKGRSLAVFMDPFEEVMPEQQQSNMMFQQRPSQPVSVPIETGLERLLEHYGLNTKKAYVLDESSFKQRTPQGFGVGEQPIYFAPIVQNEFINKDVAYLNNIKGLVLFKAAPVGVNQERVKAQGLKAVRLFSSTKRAWEMTGNITLIPSLIQKPTADSDFQSRDLAYVLEGPFESYFAERPVPERPEAEQPDGTEEEGVDTSSISAEATIKKGKPGRIFLIGTSEILRDNIIDAAGQNPNAQFVLNIIDHLYGNEDFAVMRSKSQGYNPLKKTTPGLRTTIKALCVAGLPALVVLFGVFVWGRRAARKRNIQRVFAR